MKRALWYAWRAFRFALKHRGAKVVVELKAVKRRPDGHWETHQEFADILHELRKMRARP